MRNRRTCLAFGLLLTALWSAPRARADESLILDMDTVRHRMGQITVKDKQKIPAGKIELVEGKVGEACQFSFVEGARTGLATLWVNATSTWDQADGFSFWVKGDGSDSWGGLELIDGNDYRLRYGYCFPIASTGWTKVTVPWRDVIPELGGPLVDARGGFAPSKFRNFWFGKWFYWRDYPAHTFAIDEVRLELRIDLGPPAPAPQKAGTPRFLEELRARKPVTLVTMGDSLSDKRHWANRQTLWSEVLAKQLQATFGAEVKLVNPAIGGTTLSQNLILMPRWLRETPEPDLVTVCFGFNDWDSGVRGDRFAEYLTLAVDRIRRLTQGKAEVLLITTCPAHGRWETMNELGRAAYDVAKAKRTGFADLASAFHQAGSADRALQQGYWAWDKTHLGPKGHLTVSETVLRAIRTEGLGDFETADKARWMGAPAKPASSPAAAKVPDSTSRSTEEEGTLLLSSFEPGGPDWVKGVGKPVKKHATHGRYAYRIDHTGKGYAGITIDDPKILRQLKDYPLLLVDLYNPQDTTLQFSCRIDDAGSVDYGSRYNNDSCIAPPGKSTLEVNLTGLTKSNARNFNQRDQLDVASLKLVTIFLGPGSARKLYFDNVRLEGSGLPQVEGLAAYDFGPPMAPVYPGFTGCTNQVTYNDERGFGWVGPIRARNVYLPDALTGDYANGNEFRVKVPNGTYEVQLCLDGFGIWGWYPHWEWRRLSLNGRVVLDEKMTGEQFLRGFYLAHEGYEDLPGQDLWERYIAPRQVIRRYSTEVRDGLLRVHLRGSDPSVQALMFVVLYPEQVRDEGRQWMAALGQRRRTRFNTSMVVQVPEADGDPVVPTPADRARGFIPFVRHSEGELAVTARPARGEMDRGIALSAAPGEREHAILGLYPLRGINAATVTVSDLTGPGRARLEARSLRVRKVRNFLKRSGQSRLGRLRPYLLVDFKTFDLVPGITRGLWLTVTVPEEALPGEYAGKMTLHVEGQDADVALKLTVWPFKLDRVTDFTISVTGSTPGVWRTWFPGLEERWWEMADRVLANQAEHGMNAVTGGPGMRLIGLKNGQVEIDYTDFDRWIALAVKHGLSLPGDAYQGLDLRGLPNDTSKDALQKNEAAARKRFGVSYGELLRLAYGDVERHLEEKGWPKRVFSFLDEPRPEYRNVESCAELIRIRTRACPNTLFAGYYSTGGGRDVYFETMPVSISHLNDRALELVKRAGKQIWDYSGSRVRYDIGRWAFVAARQGLTGFLRNGYMYVCSDPYFDYSDDEGSWAVVYPSRNGLNDTIGWERTADGVDDYRYLRTCARLVRQARTAKKGIREAAAADAYLKETLAPIELSHKQTARLTPEGYREFKRKLATHIMALNRVLE